MVDLACRLRSPKLTLDIILSSRHANEVWIDGSTLFDYARNINVDVMVYKDLSHLWALTDGLEYDLGIAFGAPNIFPREFIKKFKIKFYNFVPVSLPGFQGAAHFSWQILTNNSEISFNLQEIGFPVNRGKVVQWPSRRLDKSFPLPIDYFHAVDGYALDELPRFIMELLGGLIARDCIDFDQLNHSESSFFPPLNTAACGYIDWDWSVRDLDRFIRAFSTPYSGATTYCNALDGPITLLYCDFEERDGCHPFLAGLVTQENRGYYLVAVRDGYLRVRGIQEAGNFRDLKVGWRFYTKKSDLLGARLYPTINY